MYGDFSSWEEVGEVDGIGKETLREIAPYVAPLPLTTPGGD
jgi:DNA uptake protein ComE-like DNA-binding protein